MFGVKKLHETLTVEVLGLKQEIKLSYAEGMIGALPVFNTREVPLAYSEDEDLIFELFVVEKD